MSIYYGTSVTYALISELGMLGPVLLSIDKIVMGRQAVHMEFSQIILTCLDQILQTCSFYKGAGFQFKKLHVVTPSKLTEQPSKQSDDIIDVFVTI